MTSVSKRIVAHARSVAEATPICAGALLHIGSRTAVDQALSRLARSGKTHADLSRDLHESRRNAVRALRAQPRQGARRTRESVERDHRPVRRRRAAHVLGLTTQIPIRSVYLTSGSRRRLRFGNLDVELRHAPRWQLAAPRRRAGEIIRALAWLGPTEVRAGLQAVLPGLSPRGHQRACRGAGDHTALDGGAGEPAGRAWLRPRSIRCRFETGARR